MMERLPQRFCPPSELGNPQRTRVSTFPQRRRLRLSNWTNCKTRVNHMFLQILVQNPSFSGSVKWARMDAKRFVAVLK